MKLIIDIPEIDYNTYKHFGNKGTYSERIIANGTSYEERPKGKWINREDMNYLDENKVTHNYFMCDKCGLVHDFIDGHTAQYNFCPNCGADMRGGL